MAATPFPYSYDGMVLRVEDVSLTLGGNLILDQVNFEIKNITRPDAIAGQVVALLGPSGIGKTQLFHILSGLNKPDSGRVLIGDPGVPVERGMVGVVAQHYPLFAHRTVMGNLLIAGERSGKSAGDCAAKAKGLLERFRLEDRADVYPSQLSGGQRQRVAIAQQIMCSDQFLLMDEPFSGLDLLAIGRVQGLIHEISTAHELNTIIVVTHDLVAAMEVCDTLILLGRNSDEQGKFKPGARIQASYNLIDRGLAWRKDIATTPEFLETLREIRQRFTLL
jgi:NitT/TauT family transport system ATP-binding protein